MSSFGAVLKRELKRITARRLYFGTCVVLPVTSRTILRTVEAVPTFNRQMNRYANEEQARVATQKKDIYGYLVIPLNFEARVMDGKSVSLPYYYHYALLSVGSEVLGAFETVLQPIALSPVVLRATSLGLTPAQTESFLLPIDEQSHPLYNPDLDYAVYLTQPFFFILLQVIILLVTVYAVGSEIKFRTGDEWLSTARGNIFIAIVAKLLPYTLIFILMSILANYVFFGVMHIPFSCGFVSLNLTAAIFVIATQSLGVFLFALFPAISIIISIVSMVGSLGATLSGVTFPAPFMFPPVYYASFLFPVRHFVDISQNLLYGDYGFAYTYVNFVSLFVFVALALLMLPRLKKAILSHKYENIR
ncbi:MAG: ABC transporter permease [Bacteroidaceae bacterium]